MYTGFLIGFNALEGGELVAIAFESSEPVETKVIVIAMALLVGYIYFLTRTDKIRHPNSIIYQILWQAKLEFEVSVRRMPCFGDPHGAVRYFAVHFQNF